MGDSADSESKLGSLVDVVLEDSLCSAIVVV
jgi:hypothetical protein